MRNKVLTCMTLGVLCMVCVYGCGKKSDSDSADTGQGDVYTETSGSSSFGEESNSTDAFPAETGGEESTESFTDAEWEYYTANGADTEIPGYTISTGTEGMTGADDSTVQPESTGETADTRPAYTASDYVSMETYVKPVFQQSTTAEVTEAEIDAELAYRAGLAGYSVSAQDVSALTDSDVVAISGQKYQTLADYRNYLRDMLSVRAQLNGIQEAFLSGLSTFFANVTVSGVPEDVLAYDERNMDQEIVAYAANLGYQTDDLEALKANTQIEQSLDQEHREELSAELVTQYIADMEGITVSDMDFEEMCTLYMAAYGYSTKEELLQSIDEKEVRDMALHVKIYNACLG